ncbi:MAG TPA: hypothetical protein VGC58_00700, partial [Candidatus Paceibacterota bacterium]
RNERNLQKEKETFEVGIIEPIVEIPTEYDDEAVNALVDDIVAGNVFTLGEVHGVKENPSIVYTLIKKFKFRQLGLEWDKDIARVVELFQTEGVLDFNAIMNSCDGRITPGYFNMLKKIKSDGLVDSIFFFDDKDSWGKRDEVMAQDIIGHTSENVPTIVVAGNAHTNLREIKEGDGTVHPSMVKFLQDKDKNFSMGEIRYISGKFFNNQVRDFGELAENPAGKTARFYKNENRQYVYELPVASLALVPNPTGIYIG